MPLVITGATNHVGTLSITQLDLSLRRRLKIYLQSKDSGDPTEERNDHMCCNCNDRLTKALCSMSAKWLTDVLYRV